MKVEPLLLVIIIMSIGVASAQLKIGYDSQDSSFSNGGDTQVTVTVLNNGSDTNESTRVANLVGTDCTGTDKVVGVGADGTVVCDADVSGSGTGKAGYPDYLYNDTDTMYFNETELNLSIDARASVTDTNWSRSDLDSIYIASANESNLNVNSSGNWDTLNTFNYTQMEQSDDVLNILESWLTTFFNALFSAKTTDDLSEGSTNLYDNQSWNESYANTLYGSGADNESWNQSFANTLYADISVVDTDTNASSCNDGEYLDGSGKCINLNETIVFWDTNVTITDTNASSCNVGEYLDGSGKCINFNETAQAWDTNITDTDTNETDRFTNLTLTDCPAGNYSYGVYDNGTVACRSDVTAVGDAPGDGNASSICGNGEYLDGSGACINFNETVVNLDTNISDTNWSTSDLNSLFNQTGDINSVNTSSLSQNSTTNLQALFNSVITWAINFTKIYSLDWSNVTITTSQITDYAAASDSNCSEGNCNQVFYWTNQSYLNETDEVNIINNTIINANSSWLDTHNSTYDAYATNVSINYTLEVYNTWNEDYTSTYNETYANNVDTNASSCNTGEYLDGSGKCINFNETVVALDTNITDTNISNWSRSDLDGIYIASVNESNLNVNSSIYWNDSVVGYNATQFNIVDGMINLMETFFSSLFDSLFSAKDTDDLSEGSSNLYDNQTWSEERYLALDITITDTNASSCGDGEYLDGSGKCINLNQTIVFWDTNISNWSTSDLNTLFNDTQWFNKSYTDTLYSDTNWSTSDLNSLFNDTQWLNKTYLDTLYAGIEWDYNQTTGTYNLYNDVWISTYNATYDSYSINVSLNYSQIVYDTWNTAYLSTYNASYVEYNATININMTNHNITGIDCLIGTGGGMIC